MNNDTFKEQNISQIPALRLLMTDEMGYTYLSPTEAIALRGDSRRNVLLTPIVRDWLAENNSISPANVEEAIRKLTADDGALIPVNEQVTELLTLGTSVTEIVDGVRKNPAVKYIDWHTPANNIYHVTEEFSVERVASHSTYRPDIVLFVNGIPLVVIECKRPDIAGSMKEAISQHVGNQKTDGILNLYRFSQLLIAINQAEGRYGTTATPDKFWSKWHEESGDEAELHRAVNVRLTAVQKQHLYDHNQNAHRIHRHFETLEQADRLPTEQDRTIFYLLRPERLLDLIRRFTVFDGGIKKVARYQQYFAVLATIEKVLHQTNGKRNGGVIWHTTGSGKSLTMVMLAKALTLHPNIPNPKVVLVTDRVNLDKQLAGTFRACGKQIGQAKSGKDLAKLVRDTKTDIIATVINKFERVAEANIVDDNRDIFVLVDESHRTQYGTTHAKMRRVFPQACYIGFTGTPLTKKEKSTAAKFGDFIHKYPMRQAVADGAVVPLLYEGRMVPLEPNQAQIDLWFERITGGLTADQQQDLKRKFSRQGEIDAAEQRVQMIAWDISEHFENNVQDGFKAMLAVPKKEIALRYLAHFETIGSPHCAVVISPPDRREGHEAVDGDVPAVQQFWARMMKRYKTEEAYNREIQASFGTAGEIELLIVVDKLLTGFDEPRAQYLYLDKPLKEHGLLQAIARVNRLFEGKEYGHIIDYRGVLGNLNDAINTYDALAEFDTEDIEGTLTSIHTIIDELPQRHTALHAVFNGVANREDTESCVQHVAPDDIRDQFYGALRTFASALKVALGSEAFYERVDEPTIKRYKSDLARFHKLRNVVKQKYAESIEYGEYEAQIRKLMDTHITAYQVEILVDEVNIFDEEAFAQAVSDIGGAEAQAEMIANQLKRTIAIRMEENPAFYQSLSAMINATILAYQEGRINDAEQLEQMQAAVSMFRQGESDTVPAEVRAHKDAAAYYGIMQNGIMSLVPDEVDPVAVTAEMAIRIEAIIEEKKRRDWVNSQDVKNGMSIALEDYLYSIKGRHDVAFAHDDIHGMVEKLLETAMSRENMRR